jgi:hypothetical protein
MWHNISMAESDVLPQVDGNEAPEDAPYGYMIDPLTGMRRPKKSPGRIPLRKSPTKATSPFSPSLDELRESGPVREEEQPSDRAPGQAKKRLGFREKVKVIPDDFPNVRAGTIAKGVNGLYRRAGKIVKGMDRDVGLAIIACTKKGKLQDPDTGKWVDDPEDITVGEAWEELAKTNPRIRAFLLKLIAGGALTQLLMAHAPIALALLMKDGIRQRLPMQRMFDAFLDSSDDEGDEEDDSPVPGTIQHLMNDLRPEDMAQMGAMFNGMMSQMANGMPRMPAPSRAPTADDVFESGP